MVVVVGHFVGIREGDSLLGHTGGREVLGVRTDRIVRMVVVVLTVVGGIIAGIEVIMRTMKTEERTSSSIR